MYPNLYYAFKDLFGIDWKPLRFVNSFGFFVAIAFIVAAVILVSELRRKSKQGLLYPTEMEITVGRPATGAELLLNFLLGFLLGYKIIALLVMDSYATDDPQAFIFSANGNWPLGIGLGLFFAGLKWWDRNKQKLAKPEKRIVRIWPHDRVGEITIIALVFGLIGAKLFDIFENWSAFLQKPSDFLLSPSGLTFYGGLICAALAIWWYARRHKIGFWHLNDAAAPALMIAYAVGRIGCQVAGDGDWGIHNTAYMVDQENKVVLATPGDFEQKINTYKIKGEYFDLKDTPETVPHASFKKPGALGFLPNWMFAYQYPHNVNKTGVTRVEVTDHDRETYGDKKYPTQLPVPVFPTPFYETIACLLLFLVLWSVRKKLKVPGTLFGLYLMLNGIERFFIEKIRVNTTINLFGFHPTQAEVISTLLFLAGLAIWIILRRKGQTEKSTSVSASAEEK